MDLIETRKKLHLQLNELTSKIINSVYESRFVKIIITHYNKEFWVYMGPRSDYLIIPKTFCSCKDFIIRVVALRQSYFCKHLVGVEIAVKTNRFRAVKIELEDFIRIVNEITRNNFSTTLRKKIYM